MEEIMKQKLISKTFAWELGDEVIREEVERIKKQFQRSAIAKNVISLILYGSTRSKEDFHKKSDIDLHLVLRSLDGQSLKVVRRIMVGCQNVDISIHQLSEIISDTGNITFQNGTQGVYFIHVLASGEILLGKNIYKEMLDKIDSIDLKKSIILKIREYVWKIRRISMENVDLMILRKYMIRFLKDILLLYGDISLDKIDSVNNRQVVNTFIDKYSDRLDRKEIDELVCLPVLHRMHHPDIDFLILLIGKILTFITI